jgi:hypothetical protein
MNTRLKNYTYTLLTGGSLIGMILILIMLQG